MHCPFEATVSQMPNVLVFIDDKKIFNNNFFDSFMKPLATF